MIINNKMKKIKAIIFDIDGVLVDVSESYRVAIKKTAEFFLGKILSMDDVDAIKNKGINNDWDAAEMLIQEGGGDFRKKVIIKKFQEHYLGREFDGLINKEKCLIKEDTLKKLKNYKLAIFTGRPKMEAKFALKRLGIEKYFEYIVCMEDVKEEKPYPEGLLKILKKLNVSSDKTIYVGDNIADVRASKNAKVNFIGVVPPGADKAYTKDLLKSEGAKVVIDNVNEIVNEV